MQLLIEGGTGKEPSSAFPKDHSYKMNFYTLIALSRSSQAESKSAYKNQKTLQTRNLFLHRNGTCLFTERNAVDLYFSTLILTLLHTPHLVCQNCVRTFFTVNQFVQLKRRFILGISFIDKTDLAVSKHHCRRPDL